MPLRLVPPIHRATHRIGLYLADLRDEALSQGESHILALLATAGPSTIADLHRGLAHKRSTLTSILDRLAERGLVTRAVGASDRRTFVITPTAKGRRVAGRVHRHLTDLERAAAARVTGDDIRGFMKVLAAVEDEAHQRTAHVRKSQVSSLKSGALKPRP
jgi:DNA-binding MarR family transcriptional regulator